MAFHGILFDHPEDRRRADEAVPPGYLPDLNLDQLVASITASRATYHLEPYFQTVVRSVDAVRYRHAALRDLHGTGLLAPVRTFAARMREVRERTDRADRTHYRHQQQRWIVDAADTYCQAVSGLVDGLAAAPIRSAAFRALRDYLSGYAESGAFTALRAETRRLLDDLAGIRYNLHIASDRVRVIRYDGEPDYTAEVADTFAKFKQGEAGGQGTRHASWREMNHVEAAVLDMVARLYPNIFRSLDDYCARHPRFLDPTIVDFDREVQFYVAYLEYMDRFRPAGLDFCYPTVSQRPTDLHVRDTFDIALADKLVREGRPVVRNDIDLAGPERVIVVSGPNQGGKTTFARAFGQLHHLAALGLPVPGSHAQLSLFDQLHTHFAKEEDATSLRGKLEDDLVRIHDVLGRATADSIIVMNEAFTSTTLDDAVLLGRRILGQIIDLGARCVCVTFVDELSRLPTTVSMVSTVDPDDPAVRTFRIVRQPADGLAYAATIAEKYGLTYDRIRERMAP